MNFTFVVTPDDIIGYGALVICIIGFIVVVIASVIAVLINKWKNRRKDRKKK